MGWRAHCLGCRARTNFGFLVGTAESLRDGLRVQCRIGSPGEIPGRIVMFDVHRVLYKSPNLTVNTCRLCEALLFDIYIFDIYISLTSMVAAVGFSRAESQGLYLRWKAQCRPQQLEDLE